MQNFIIRSPFPKTRVAASHLEPALGHEEVVFDAVVAKLLGHVETHGAVLVVDIALVLVTEDGVGVVDLLEPLGGLRVVWVFIWVMPQRQFPSERKMKFDICRSTFVTTSYDDSY